MDFRALNKLTEPKTYLLPHIDECYQNLAGIKFFTRLDLRSGNWQVHLTEEAKRKLFSHAGIDTQTISST